MLSKHIVFELKFFLFVISHLYEWEGVTWFVAWSCQVVKEICFIILKVWLGFCFSKNASFRAEPPRAHTPGPPHQLMDSKTRWKHCLSSSSDKENTRKAITHKITKICKLIDSRSKWKHMTYLFQCCLMLFHCGDFYVTHIVWVEFSKNKSGILIQNEKREKNILMYNNCYFFKSFHAKYNPLKPTIDVYQVRFGRIKNTTLILPVLGNSGLIYVYFIILKHSTQDTRQPLFETKLHYSFH